MNNILKRIGKSILFPHFIVIIALAPISCALLIYSMIYLNSTSLVSILSYILSAYTLTVICIKIPRIIDFINRLKKDSAFIKLWQSNIKIRLNTSLYVSCILNIAYSVFQLVLGLYHSSFWYYSLAIYYLILAFIRYYLVRYTTKNTLGEKLYEELLKYRICGIVLFGINIALSVIIFFMIYWGRTFTHHQITAIAIAAFTFYSFIDATVKIIKYRKYASPIINASKAINLAAACVSMITLTAVMLTAFGNSQVVSYRKAMLASVGGTVALFITFMSAYIIVTGNKKINLLNDCKPKKQGEGNA